MAERQSMLRDCVCDYPGYNPRHSKSPWCVCVCVLWVWVGVGGDSFVLLSFSSG